MDTGHCCIVKCSFTAVTEVMLKVCTVGSTHMGKKRIQMLVGRDHYRNVDVKWEKVALQMGRSVYAVTHNTGFYQFIHGYMFRH
jgi:transcription elongation factor GreA-like protein